MTRLLELLVGTALSALFAVIIASNIGPQVHAYFAQTVAAFSQVGH